MTPTPPTQAQREEEAVRYANALVAKPRIKEDFHPFQLQAYDAHLAGQSVGERRGWDAAVRVLREMRPKHVRRDPEMSPDEAADFLANHPQNPGRKG